ncbi:hypothetical protein QWI17_10745 [Gilvimarinus sp. SDUM040013]|uniref:Uncharacterized protein n=1 Tax=Gilvimarinus gilvus TaxID=3058038 RepID=A0ABU4S0J7_9GAMM|nr:hypothetical protein [Gilvimarinus sp. SDUM040013]MDO3386316.1 hypothetical protein [Gilvimarinus sp. SDUM040013]MDX6850026.1 hypothetical protein [Gilvimarinus sp. SDUM040013]
MKALLLFAALGWLTFYQIDFLSKATFPALVAPLLFGVCGMVVFVRVIKLIRPRQLWAVPTHGEKKAARKIFGKHGTYVAGVKVLPRNPYRRHLDD